METAVEPKDSTILKETQEHILLMGMIQREKLDIRKGRNNILGWPKSSFRFKVKIKDTLFIFTKKFIEQHIHHFVPLPSAMFQATS